MNQQQQNLLVPNVRRGVEICLLSWPTLRHALQSSWISQNKNLNNSQRIASLKKMSNNQITYALIDELETYILKHEVDPVHLEDWFEQLMDQVFCADCDDSFIKVMAKQLVDLVKDLEDGSLNKMKEFEDAYEKMKTGKFSISRLAGNDSDESEEQEEQDKEQGQKMDEEQQEKAPQLIQKPQLTQQQQALQDDGWTIVTKKKK